MKHLRTFEELNQSTYNKVAKQIGDKYPGLASKMRKHSNEFGLNKPNFTLLGYVGNNKTEILSYKPENVSNVDDGVINSRGNIKKYYKKEGKWSVDLNEQTPYTIKITKDNEGFKSKIMNDQGTVFLPKTKKDAFELEKYLKQWEGEEINLDKKNNAVDVWGDWVNDLK